MHFLRWTVFVCLMKTLACRAKQDHSHVAKQEIETGESVGCYVCASMNGSNPMCHDDFDKADPATRSLYKAACSAPKFDKNGRPIGKRSAKKCYKLKAKRDSDDFHIIVRDCDAIIEGSDPQDTIGSTNYHCPTKIIIGQESYHGCLLTCDFDGCNRAAHVFTTNAILVCAAAVSAYFLFSERTGAL